MTEGKHKGIEFSNVSQMWAKNENNKAGKAETDNKGSEFSNVTEVWAQNERKKGTGAAPGERSTDKETVGSDYWDRIADDVASGYEGKEDDDSILNIDQEPGDNEPEHKASEE